MKTILTLFLVSMLFVGFVCKTGKKTKISTERIDSSQHAQPAQLIDTTQGAVTGVDSSAAIAQRTAVKPNISRVKGTVKEINLIDSVDFRIEVTIDSSFSIGELASLAESGQDLTLKPRFVLNMSGVIDTMNERNRRFIHLRSRSPGSFFSGKITLQGKGAWVILDADSL